MGREIQAIPVRDLMSSPVVTVRPETDLSTLTGLMQAHEYHAFPVVDEFGVLQGLVSRTDLFKVYLLPYRRFIAALEESWAASVGSIMTRGVVTLYPTEFAIDAMALVVDHRLRTIPVVDDTVAGRVVVGVITPRDLAGALKP